MKGKFTIVKDILVRSALIFAVIGRIQRDIFLAPLREFGMTTRCDMASKGWVQLNQASAEKVLSYRFMDELCGPFLEFNEPFGAF